MLSFCRMFQHVCFHFLHSSRTWSGVHLGSCGWWGGRFGGCDPQLCVRMWRLLLLCFSVLLRQQVRGDVPGLGLGLLLFMSIVRGSGWAAAPLVLPSEAPQFRAPMFPPREGQSGAVGHQTTLLGAPASLPLLGRDQEERAAHLEGWAAAAEVAVRDPEGVGAPAHVGGRPCAKDWLDWDGKLPPGAWTLHPSHLHLQHWQRQDTGLDFYSFFN